MTVRCVRPGRGRPADDQGAVAGVEVLLFGVVVLVGLILLFAQVWRVYEAESAVRAGAREAARTYVESDGGSTGPAGAAGLAALAQLGFDGGTIAVSAPGGFARCQVVYADAAVRVAPVSLPFVGSVLGYTATARHGELVDPLRTGLDGDATACLDG